MLARDRLAIMSKAAAAIMLLLLSLTWIMGLTAPFFTVFGEGRTSLITSAIDGLVPSD